MKTLNACAFRNFDSQRILSRPYFEKWRRDCHVETGLSDEEILKSLDATDDDSLDELEQKLKTLREAYAQLSEFIRFFWRRHVEARLDPYNKRKAKKYGVKVAELSSIHRPAPIIEYFTASLDCRELMKKISDFYHDLEDKTEQRYRAEFASRLKRLRHSAGLTQKQLGDVIQISPQGVSMYEAGKREPSITSLFRLAKILPINELFGRT